VVLHDAQVYRHPEFFSRSYLALHRALGRLFARTAHLATVSNFSRSELAQALRLPIDAFTVIPNSAEHIRRSEPDERIIGKLGLKRGSYFMALGTMTRNKNLTLAIQASALLDRPDYPLVIVGGDNRQVFDDRDVKADRAVLAGRLHDTEIAALYKHASAFIFPSLYEGFGVPPLEAMAFGCPVIASTAAAVVETCGDGASYFDPHNAPALAELMRRRIAGEPPLALIAAEQEKRLQLFSWHRSARSLLDALVRLR
jgi:glycosyltransferase involved in cell wall biosynthesis